MLGAAAGLITGILFAPDKGSETRKRIADGGQRVADNLKETLNSGKSYLNDLKDKYMSKMENSSVEESMNDRNMI